MISHSHRCIFIHVPKTAGQSIERVFLKDVGLCWDDRAPLLLRENARPSLGPPSLAHLPADEYVELQYISDCLFSTYFKFAFVRNPWDRAVSFYRFLGYSSWLPFDSFVEDHLATLSSEKWFFRPQVDFITNAAGTVLVDFVGRFERLETDFRKICREVGLPETQLPHTNVSDDAMFKPMMGRKLDRWLRLLFRQASLLLRQSDEPSEFRDYYDRESIERVATIYQPDIELFGYSFD
jgi:hypothetical protein